MVRFIAALALLACAGCSAEPPPVAVIPAGPPAEAVQLTDDCRGFTATSFLAGRPLRTSGTACRQTDGAWRITAETPLPEAAIAMAGPVLTAEETSTAAGIWYAFDPEQHHVSFFDAWTGWPGDGAAPADGMGSGSSSGFHRFHRHGFGRRLANPSP